ncbi:MAG: UDP-N-acetylmuramate--L-alanine ligase [Crocinitomicaceae bacterium]|nr:UDP-N-acetylmuramate--L-alanine ligase [Crocinitomicaceae bacterium]
MQQVNIPISQFNSAYFIGVGGIGMSALARYFHSRGWSVGGYDKTQTELTVQLQKEGILVSYTDLGNTIPEAFNSTENTLVIYTPAIPSDMGELSYVQNNGFHVYKRAQVLGMITRDSKALCVAGTHGKTTTSTMLAHILDSSSLKCNAFLGGISTNFNSNFISDSSSDLTVIEADEFDRSFLQLTPFASIITSTDADHLDIYGNTDDFLQGFKMYADLIAKNGCLIKHIDVELDGPSTITYGLNCDADYSGSNLVFEEGEFLFDVDTPSGKFERIELGIPGIHNAENAIACIALSYSIGVSEQEIRDALASFKGVKRRFEYHYKTDDLVYIDDYAHHPTEIHALISSIRLLYPGQRITGVFQPHLFTRTRDFFDGFVQELSQLDELVLLPIYPARELPIEGITSNALAEKINKPTVSVQSPSEAVAHVSNVETGIILTIGAGDIDRIIQPIKNTLQAR